MPVKKGVRQIAENRKARHEYFIEDTYECGLALVGTEVKSIRAGKVGCFDGGNVKVYTPDVAGRYIFQPFVE